MTPRATQALLDAGLSPAQAAMLPDAELLRLPGFGIKALRELRAIHNHPAVDALTTLNGWANEYMAGQLDERRVRAVLTTLAQALPVRHPDALVDELMRGWQ